MLRGLKTEPHTLFTKMVYRLQQEQPLQVWNYQQVIFG